MACCMHVNSRDLQRAGCHLLVNLSEELYVGFIYILHLLRIWISSHLDSKYRLS